MTGTSPTRCCGLLGGLGVGATVHYYRALVNAREQGSRPLRLVMTHVDVRQVFDLVQQDRKDLMAEYLAPFLHQLHAAGAHFAAIPAVLPHFCIQQLIPLSPLPLVNMLELIRTQVAVRQVKRLGILGTRFTMETQLFGTLRDLTEIIVPTPPELDCVHDLYSKLLIEGRESVGAYQEIAKVARSLMQRDGAEVILLAGTELSLIFNRENTQFPNLNSADIHVEAIAESLG